MIKILRIGRVAFAFDSLQPIVESVRYEYLWSKQIYCSEKYRNLCGPHNKHINTKTENVSGVLHHSIYNLQWNGSFNSQDATSIFLKVMVAISIIPSLATIPLVIKTVFNSSSVFLWNFVAAHYCPAQHRPTYCTGSCAEFLTHLYFASTIHEAFSRRVLMRLVVSILDNYLCKYKSLLLHLPCPLRYSDIFSTLKSISAHYNHFSITYPFYKPFLEKLASCLIHSSYVDFHQKLTKIDYPFLLKHLNEGAIHYNVFRAWHFVSSLLYSYSFSVKTVFYLNWT